MSRLRTVLIVVALLTGVPILLVLGAVAYVQAQLPPTQEARVRGAGNLVGIQTGSSYAWVLPSEGGVILVDAGLDPTAKALKREIGQRSLQAVLLTHGHADHVGGLSDLGEVPVYASAEAFALMDGERQPKGWLSYGLSRFFSAPAIEGERHEIESGAEIEIDGVRLLPTAAPGHSPGSVVWLWEDVLFTGDAVLGGSPLSLAPSATSDDPLLAERSLDGLLPLDFDTLADGHVGLTSAARPALFRLANDKIAPPTVSVRTGGEGGAVGDVLERKGVLVQAPAPDVRGQRPELLLMGDGQVWRLGDRPDPDRAALDGKTVVVEARLLPGTTGPGLPVEVVSIRADDRPTPADRPLSDRVGQWIEVTGTITGFRPLAAAAAWGEGSIALATPDAPTYPFSAPTTPPRQRAPRPR